MAYATVGPIRNLPWSGWRQAQSVVHLGLGDDTSLICLDQAQNTIPCSDPDCAYGDCGGTGHQVMTGPLCLDQQENAVACADANCTYGDCISGAKKSGGGATVTAGTPPIVIGAPSPSPTVQVPLKVPGGFGLFLESSTLISGIPNFAVLAGGLLLTAGLAGGISGGGGRRRR